MLFRSVLRKRNSVGPQNLRKSADERVVRLQGASTELIRAMKGEKQFPTKNHLQRVEVESSDGRKTGIDVSNFKLEGYVKNLEFFDRFLYLRVKQMGSWTTICCTTVTGRVLFSI